jgi:hypothetical protein
VARLEVGGTWDGVPVADGERVRVTLALEASHLRLAVDAPFHADPPPPGPPGPTPGLWEHEVVEVFVAGDGPPDAVPYTEVELGPGGHHLALRFRGVRRRVEEGLLPVELATAVSGGRWRAEARLPLACLPPPPWRAAAFALHGAGADRRYLSSLPLPGPRPDFHQPHLYPPLAVTPPGPGPGGRRVSPEGAAGLELRPMPGRLAVCRLAAGAPVPPWAVAGGWWSLTRTAEELSVVCAEGRVPPGVAREGGWRALAVAGPLDLGATGVLASLAAPLAAAGLSLFAVSTYDTDYLLVKEERLAEALAALEGAGHRVAGSPPPAG